jgi:membrane protein
VRLPAWHTAESAKRADSTGESLIGVCQRSWTVPRVVDQAAAAVWWLVSASNGASVTSFNLAILVGLLLSFAGTVAVARCVEVIYERAFDYPPLARAQGWLRGLVWVVVIFGVLIADGTIERTSIADVGHVVFGLVEFVLFTLFFWCSAHFLLAGRASWREVRSAAIATGLLWMGLGMFAAFYFSSTIVSDSKTYGTIGVTFTLATWFIAIGAVITSGAVVGAVWHRRRIRSTKPTAVSGERSDAVSRSPEHVPAPSSPPSAPPRRDHR